VHFSPCYIFAVSNLSLQGGSLPKWYPSIKAIKRLRECIEGRLLANMSVISLSVFQLMTLSSKSTIFE